MRHQRCVCVQGTTAVENLIMRVEATIADLGQQVTRGAPGPNRGDLQFCWPSFGWCCDDLPLAVIMREATIRDGNNSGYRSVFPKLLIISTVLSRGYVFLTAHPPHLPFNIL